MSNPRKARIVLLAIDGLDWPTLRRLFESGGLPHLAAMARDGAWGELDVESAAVGLDGLGPDALISPMLWTTAASGVYYFTHGVFDFRDSIGNPADPPLFTSADVAVARIWDILTAHQRASVVVGYMVTHPASAIRGVMISDYFGEVNAPTVAGPPSLAEELAAALGAADYSTLVQREMATGPMDEMEPWTAPPGISSDEQRERVAAVLREFLPDPDAELARYVAAASDADVLKRRSLLYHRLIYPCLRDDRFHQSLRFLLTRVPDWEFAVCYYRCIDAISHGFWLDSPCAGLQFRQRYAGVLDKAYARADRYVGAVRSMLEDGDIVLVASDHGFTGEALPTGGTAGDDLEYQRVGNHRAPGVFLAAGPGVRRGEVEGVSLLDLTPTILDRLGLPQAEAFDGGVVPGLLHPDAPLDLPKVAGYERPASQANPELSTTEERRIMERLQALGYIQE